jgi:hypothetical protein
MHLCCEEQLNSNLKKKRKDAQNYDECSTVNFVVLTVTFTFNVYMIKPQYLQSFLNLS